MEYNINIQKEVKEVNIDELQELKAEIDRKLMELKDKEKLLDFKSLYSLDHASVKLSFKTQ